MINLFQKVEYTYLADTLSITFAGNISEPNIKQCVRRAELRISVLLNPALADLPADVTFEELSPENQTRVKNAVSYLADYWLKEGLYNERSSRSSSLPAAGLSKSNSRNEAFLPPVVKTELIATGMYKRTVGFSSHEDGVELVNSPVAHGGTTKTLTVNDPVVESTSGTAPKQKEVNIENKNSIASISGTVTTQGNTITTQGNTITTQGNTITNQGTEITALKLKTNVLDSAGRVPAAPVVGTDIANMDYVVQAVAGGGGGTTYYPDSAMPLPVGTKYKDSEIYALDDGIYELTTTAKRSGFYMQNQFEQTIIGVVVSWLEITTVSTLEKRIILTSYSASDPAVIIKLTGFIHSDSAGTKWYEVDAINSRDMKLLNSAVEGPGLSQYNNNVNKENRITALEDAPSGNEALQAQVNALTTNIDANDPLALRITNLRDGQQDNDPITVGQVRSIVPSDYTDEIFPFADENTSYTIGQIRDLPIGRFSVDDALRLSALNLGQIIAGSATISYHSQGGPSFTSYGDNDFARAYFNAVEDVDQDDVSWRPKNLGDDFVPSINLSVDGDLFIPAGDPNIGKTARLNRHSRILTIPSGYLWGVEDSVVVQSKNLAQRLVDHGEIASSLFKSVAGAPAVAIQSLSITVSAAKGNLTIETHLTDDFVLESDTKYFIRHKFQDTDLPSVALPNYESIRYWYASSYIGGWGGLVGFEGELSNYRTGDVIYFGHKFNSSGVELTRANVLYWPRISLADINAISAVSTLSMWSFDTLSGGNLVKHFDYTLVPSTSSGYLSYDPRTVPPVTVFGSRTYFLRLQLPASNPTSNPELDNLNISIETTNQFKYTIESPGGYPVTFVVARRVKIQEAYQTQHAVDHLNELKFATITKFHNADGETNLRAVTDLSTEFLLTITEEQDNNDPIVWKKTANTSDLRTDEVRRVDPTEGEGAIQAFININKEERITALETTPGGLTHFSLQALQAAGHFNTEDVSCSEIINLFNDISDKGGEVKVFHENLNNDPSFNEWELMEKFGLITRQKVGVESFSGSFIQGGIIVVNESTPLLFGGGSTNQIIWKNTINDFASIYPHAKGTNIFSPANPAYNGKSIRLKDLEIQLQGYNFPDNPTETPEPTITIERIVLKRVAGSGDNWDIVDRNALIVSTNVGIIDRFGVESIEKIFTNVADETWRWRAPVTEAGFEYRIAFLPIWEHSNPNLNYVFNTIAIEFEAFEYGDVINQDHITIKDQIKISVDKADVVGNGLGNTLTVSMDGKNFLGRYIFPEDPKLQADDSIVPKVIDFYKDADSVVSHVNWKAVEMIPVVQKGLVSITFLSNYADLGSGNIPDFQEIRATSVFDQHADRWGNPWVYTLNTLKFKLPFIFANSLASARFRIVITSPGFKPRDKARWRLVKKSANTADVVVGEWASTTTSAVAQNNSFRGTAWDAAFFATLIFGAEYTIEFSTSDWTSGRPDPSVDSLATFTILEIDKTRKNF